MSDSNLEMGAELENPTRNEKYKTQAYLVLIYVHGSTYSSPWARMTRKFPINDED